MPDNKRDKDDGKKKKAVTTTKLSLEEASYAAGYETDVGPSSSTNRKKSKIRKRTRPAAGGSLDAGYETDEGYMSTPTSGGGKKSKSRFFRLGNKSKSQLEDVRAETPSPPPPPVFRLPIAERFATTLRDINASANQDPPLGDPVLPPPTKEAAGRDAETVRDSSTSSGSSNPSIFSKVASSDPSSPTSSSASHSNTAPKISFADQVQIHKRPDPLSLSPYLPTSVSASSSRAPSPTDSPFVVLTPIDPSAPPPSETNDSPSRSRKRRFIPKAVEDISLKIGSAKTPQVVTVTVDPTPVEATQVVIIPGLPPSPTLPEESASRPDSTILPDYIVPQVIVSEATVISDNEADTNILDEEDEMYSRYRYSQRQPLGSSISAPPSRSISPALTIGGGGRRGVQPAFPTKPVLPRSTTPTRGFETKVNVERYRDLYTYTPPTVSRPMSPAERLFDDDDDVQKQRQRQQRPATIVSRTPTMRSRPRDDENTAWTNRTSVRRGPPPPPVPSLRNLKPLKPTLAPPSPSDADSQSDYGSRDPDDSTPTLTKTLYNLNNDSAASRRSILDQNKSSDARRRFVDRIEALFDDDEREKLKLRTEETTSGRGARSAPPIQVPVPKWPPPQRSTMRTTMTPVATKSTGWF